MRIDIMTLFPDMCEVVFNESIIGRALRRGALEIHARDIRYFTHDKHNRVDDAPYGGGTGMLMQAQPIYDCFVSLCDELGTVPHCIFMSPQGKSSISSASKSCLSWTILPFYAATMKE